MCTATYLPVGTNGFILTHSRDEKISRPLARPPRPTQIGGQTVTFPRDPQGLGTWIAYSASLAVCLLNGAFVPPPSRLPGPGDQPRPSRGLVVLAAFTYDSTDEFIQQHPFAGFDPFTLLLIRPGRLTEIRWTGNQLLVSEKNPASSHIWSSVTLYSAEVRRARERWFADWQQTSCWSVAGIRAFHQSAGQPDCANALRMHRPGRYQTVSLTSVLHVNGRTAMHYEPISTPGQPSEPARCPTPVSPTPAAYAIG